MAYIKTNNVAIKGFSFHHIGMAVFNIEETARFYESTGWQRTVETIYDPCQNVKVCFYSKAGFPTIELIEAVDEKSPINNILTKLGGGKSLSSLLSSG